MSSNLEPEDHLAKVISAPAAETARRAWLANENFFTVAFMITFGVEFMNGAALPTMRGIRQKPLILGLVCLDATHYLCSVSAGSAVFACAGETVGNNFRR
jgi:hypothetical protein